MLLKVVKGMSLNGTKESGGVKGLQLKSLQTALDRSSGPAVPVRGIFKRTQHPIGRDGGALIPWDGALNRTVQGS
ncbi:hypothetical protein DTO164E3_3339 [Paecilomyces variotii]|nr:hypothetical protein DTO164E3_3339 [Paecilomyces variotii]KAJ9264664.1 hypothetical protein DTO212C5_7046 [Paecilomyces variotii]